MPSDIRMFGIPATPTAAARKLTNTLPVGAFFSFQLDLPFTFIFKGTIWQKNGF